MARTSRNADPLRALVDEIEVVRHDEHGRPLGVLPDLRRLLGFDAVAFARPTERTTGWTVEGFESDGFDNPTRFRRSLASLFEASARPTPWLDLQDAPKDERNVAVDVEERVGRVQYRESALYQRVLAPSGLADARVARLLICDGHRVLAWIGGFSQTPLARPQREMFASIAPALRHRVRIERLLGAAPRIHAALEATLQQIGAPAMLVDARGRIHEVNRAARELLASKRAEVSASISAVLAKKPPSLPFSLTRVSATGVSDQFLAVMRPHSAEARAALSVTIAASRWKLTPRQAQVLRLIVQGESNAQIARQLQIGRRAAELHITAIFDRAGVASRSQLVAAVLLG